MDAAQVAVAVIVSVGVGGFMVAFGVMIGWSASSSATKAVLDKFTFFGEDDDDDDDDEETPAAPDSPLNRTHSYEWMFSNSHN